MCTLLPPSFMGGREMPTLWIHFWGLVQMPSNASIQSGRAASHRAVHGSRLRPAADFRR